MRQNTKNTTMNPHSHEIVSFHHFPSFGHGLPGAHWFHGPVFSSKFAFVHGGFAHGSAGMGFALGFAVVFAVLLIALSRNGKSS